MKTSTRKSLLSPRLPVAGASGTRRAENSSAWRQAVCSLLCLQLSAGSATPAWAQRRSAEPEANPQFAQQLQQQQGGGPVGEGAAPADAYPPEEPGGPPGGGAPDDAPQDPYATRPAGAAPGVQIGPATQRRVVSDIPTNPLETRIVVRVKNAPLSTFLDTISAQAKVNFIITEGLEDKRVTAFLQNVTVREALQILLEIKGLTYQRIGKSNTYVVSPRAKGVPNRITRIYTLSYIPLVPIQAGPADLTQRVNSGTQSSTPATTPMDAGGGGGGDMGGGPGQAQKDGPIAILNVLRSVLSRQYGSIAVDARTNAIIITDIPEVFPQVEQILAELDKKAPQVIIEAQIVEINSDRAQQLGLEWGGSNGELAVFTGPRRDTAFPLNLPRNLSNTHFFDPVDRTPPIQTQIASGVQGGGGQGQQGQGGGDAGAGGQGGVQQGLFLQSGILDLTQLRIILRALVTRAEARFLGKPKILTLNNKPATIQITQDQAVSVTSQITSAQNTAQQTVTVTRVVTGLTLKVTPQVNREGFITMLVEPAFTDVRLSDISAPGTSVFDPVTRGASTLVRVKNGQTLVLGGLLQSRETKTVKKVPFFGYIPLIGWLFTSIQNSRKNTDLVIFITPTVVND